MAVTQKIIDLSNTDKTANDWLRETKGVWMNMLNGVYYNQVDKTYHFLPILYSDVSLQDEKIKPKSNQEFTVVFSCLVSEYENKQEVKDRWWKAANEVKEAYIEQQKIEQYIDTNNTDLKRLRKEGVLEDKESLAKEYNLEDK